MGNDSSSPSASPSPIVYSPSQEFIGNDGHWSAFLVRVGSPAQNFRVLPSSKSSEIYIPIVDGCERDNITSCGPLRGAYDFNGRESSGFLVNSSSTWNEIGLYEVDARPDLDFTANALYGLDNLGLMLQNSGGPTLPNQVIAAMANPAIWVGMVGLGQKPANFSEFDNPQEGLISTLKKKGMIPSMSYGYTAGAWYKRPQALASLTLGGYDQSKFVDNEVFFDFDPNDDKPLSLNVQSMVAQNTFNGSTNLLDVLSQPVYVTIDYTVPHLWLPRAVCDNFESVFHLTYDNSTDMYLVNDTVHSQLKSKNPSITIGFGKTADPGARVNIVLPYSAFDLQASHPIYPNTTNYFPIRRALNESMYTLGRTLMQEAYLKVDYERTKFSIHQTLFPDTNAKQEVVPLLSPSDSTMATEQHGGVHLSAGAIAGIVIGDVAVLLLLVLLGLCISRWHSTSFKWRSNRQADEERPVKKTHFDGELPNSTRHEKDGTALFEADGAGLVELHYQGLRLNVNVDRSYELSGDGSTPVRITISPTDTQSHRRADSVFPRRVDHKTLEADATETRRFSFDSQVSTWI